MTSLRGTRAYMDASTAIYAIEEPATFPNLKPGLLDLLDAGDLIVVTSELALLERLVKPRRLGDLLLEQAYRDLLTKTHVELRPIDAAVLERAVDLRLLGLKTPDAIHVATGLLEGCDVFLTRDKEWARASVTIIDPEEVA